MPAALDKAMRQELGKVLERLASQMHDRLASDYTVLLAYCGDKSSLEETRRFARTDGLNDDLRLRAIEALWFLEPPDAIFALVERLLSGGPASGSVQFRGRILDAIGELNDPEVATVVLKAFSGLSAPLKPKAIELLTERPAWTKALLAAVVDKKIPASALNVTQLRKLQQSQDTDISRRVKAIWGTIREGRNPQRERIVAQVRRAIRRTPGDPAAGQTVFTKLCTSATRSTARGKTSARTSPRTVGTTSTSSSRMSSTPAW